MKESIVLLLLGACWAGYLGWYWRENRKTSDRHRDGIRAFSAGLGTLGGSTARIGTGPALVVPNLVPRTAAEAARRRRGVLTGLSAAAVLTLFAAIGIGGMAVFVHLLVDAALVVYGYLLVQRRNAAAEREIKVHMLYPERAAAPVAEPVRAVGS